MATRRRCFWAVIAIGLTATIGRPTLAEEPPQRIVSMNLCVDQLVLLLAERERIVSLSYAATDPAVSYLAALAEGLPGNYGRAEEILPLQPDLVLAGSFTARPTVALLRRLGFRVVDVPDATSIDDIRQAIRQVAQAIGEVERGEALIAAFDARLASAPPVQVGPRPLAAFLSLGLYSFGAGTLVGDILTQAGFENLQDRLGLPAVGPIPLEALLTTPPEVLAIGTEAQRKDSLSLAMLRHPALRGLAESRETLSLDGLTWVCGAPVVAEVVLRLAELRQTTALP